MGIAVDVALATGDPVRSWNDWQREQLTLWKAGAAATTTPALFSAIAAYSMPKGRPAFES
jgi:hypothetical protein